MADDKEQPIIIKKKKGGHGGPHGGAWKLAYADLVTAMMAFFLVMWIVGLDVKTRNGLAEYFSNPGAFRIDYKSSPYILRTDGRASLQAEKVEVSSRRVVNIDINEAEALAGRIRASSSADSALSAARSHMDVRVVDDGVHIEFSETSTGTLFVPGSAELLPAGRQLLQAIAPTLLGAGRGLVVRGYAARRPDGVRYGPWDLSIDRANSVRKALVSGGFPPGRLNRVEGLADRQPKIAEAPDAIENDRISLLIPFESD